MTLSPSIPSPVVRKSIQRGTIAINVNAATSATATITAVVLAKSTLRLMGYSITSTGPFSTTDVGPDEVYPRLTFTNTTTITATIGGNGGTGTLTAAFEVEEHY